MVIICIGFTPDEEVGNGVEYFDIKSFGADYAYTVDGGVLGDMSYECFHAASARVTVHGKSVHPGTAKNVMKNAIKLAYEFIEKLSDLVRAQSQSGARLRRLPLILSFVTTTELFLRREKK